MEHRRLGQAGPLVSLASLGAGGHSRLGRASGAAFEDAVRLVRRAVELGITMVDTAPAYGTEEVVGVALQEVGQPVVVSTKAAVTDGEGNNVRPEELRRSVEASLRRLRRERIDVLYLHGVPPEAYDYCVSELLPEMRTLRREGKIEHIGISERFAEDPAHLMMRRAAADAAWDVLMVGLNYLNQSAISTVLPLAKGRGAGIVCMYAVRGNLADPVRLSEFMKELVRRGEIAGPDADVDKLISEFGDGLTTPGLADLGYRFCSHTTGVDSVLTGTGSLEHLEANVRSISAGPLSPTLVAELGRLFGRVHSLTGEGF